MRKFSSGTPEDCGLVCRELIAEIRELPEMAVSELVPEKTALIIVDVVNGFARQGAMASPLVEGIVPAVAALAEKCLDMGIPVAALADCHKEDCAEFSSFPPHCVEGTAESELVDELRALEGVYVIKKNSTNGFHEKDFQRRLVSSPAVSTFVVVGDCTDICVLQLCLTLKTWFTQQNKQAEIIVPLSCVETYDGPGHNADFMNIAAYKIMKDSGIRFVRDLS